MYLYLTQYYTLQQPVINFGWPLWRSPGWYRDKKSLRYGPMYIEKMHWRGLARPSLKSLLAQYDPNVPRSKEEQEWLDMAPVGREFGSPDYERLMQEDAEKRSQNPSSQDRFDADIRRSKKEVAQGKLKRYEFGPATKA